MLNQSSESIKEQRLRQHSKRMDKILNYLQSVFNSKDIQKDLSFQNNTPVYYCIISMQPSPASIKAKQLIVKNQQTLAQKKYYQFGQKLKLLSHRKIQGKRYQQAEAILQQGIERLQQIQDIEDNIVFQLYQQLVQLYKDHQELMNNASEKKFTELITKRDIKEREIQIIASLVKKVQNVSKVAKIAEILIQYQIQMQQFNSIFKIVAGLSSQKALGFMNKWSENKQLTEEQIPALYMRMCLNRAVLLDIPSAKQFNSEIPQKIRSSPYYTFAKFLLQAAEIKSKQAYQAIQSSYEQFLQSDAFFKELYKSIGVKYFNKKASSGLMSLLQ